MKRIKQKFNENLAQQDYDAWFITGSKKHKIPKWAGYCLGFEIVKNYLKENSDKSASSLVSAPVEKILN